MGSRDAAWLRDTWCWIRANRWIVLGQVLGLANFLAFMLVAGLIGGDAVSGHAAGGHYFVDDKGQLTEVSRSVFLSSKWHVYSLFATHPIALICTALVYLKARGRIR